MLWLFSVCLTKQIYKQSSLDVAALLPLILLSFLDWWTLAITHWWSHCAEAQGHLAAEVSTYCRRWPEEGPCRTTPPPSPSQWTALSASSPVWRTHISEAYWSQESCWTWCWAHPAPGQSLDRCGPPWPPSLVCTCLGTGAGGLWLWCLLYVWCHTLSGAWASPWRPAVALSVPASPALPQSSLPFSSSLSPGNGKAAVKQYRRPDFFCYHYYYSYFCYCLVAEWSGDWSFHKEAGVCVQVLVMPGIFSGIPGAPPALFSATCSPVRSPSVSAPCASSFPPPSASSGRVWAQWPWSWTWFWLQFGGTVFLVISHRRTWTAAETASGTSFLLGQAGFLWEKTEESEIWQCSGIYSNRKLQISDLTTCMLLLNQPHKSLVPVSPCWSSQLQVPHVVRSIELWLVRTAWCLMEVQLLLRINPLKFSGRATTADILDQTGGNIHYDGKITPKQKWLHVTQKRCQTNTF